MGASLLVDATERLFRDYKEEGKPSHFDDDYEGTSDSDTDSASDSDPVPVNAKNQKAQAGEISPMKTHRNVSSQKNQSAAVVELRIPCFGVDCF